ncbi:TonB family protein [Psychromonas sp. PT13]|uniref:TonB family protein n=1 Tax=Psychromonas sp. PT13 TaxID=3439547 RepID=UPI003EC14F2D
MKYISHYFPFFILTLVIYGFFFHFHKESTVIPELPINSGQQSMQVELVEITETDTQAQSKPKMQTEPEQRPADSKPIEAPTIEKAIASEKTPVERANTPVTEEATPVVTKAKTQITTQLSSTVKVAKQQLNKAIKNTTADSDAMLKAEFFETEFHLPPSDLGRPAKLTKQKPKKAPKKSQTPKIITKTAKPAPTAKIIKPAPAATKRKENKKPAPTNTAKAPVKQESKNKAVFKKEPAKSSAAQNQGVLQEAIVVSGNTPTYPQRAILRNQQGRVVVKLTVSMQGKGKNPEIVTSSGYPILDNAIMDFVKQELFMPAHKGEEKIDSEQIFSFRFELK